MIDAQVRRQFELFDYSEIERHAAIKKAKKMDQDATQRAAQVLLKLAEQEPPKRGAASQHGLIVEKLKDKIIASRAKRHSWAAISNTLKSAGLNISKETLRRQLGSTVSSRKTRHDQNGKTYKSPHGKSEKSKRVLVSAEFPGMGESHAEGTDRAIAVETSQIGFRRPRI